MTQTYLVGGAVRDKLLGRPVQDRDWVVVGATPEQMLDQGYKQVGADFPVFLHPDTKEEYALARKERKAGHGYTGFVCDFGPEVTLEQDLERRDLTINAMAIDEQGNLIDPFHGQQDIEQKYLRHVSEAFEEDPLRVFRVARFFARFYPLGFRVHEDTKALMRRMSESGELQYLSAERVWQETKRALAEPAPEQYFLILRETGALGTWFAEIDSDAQQPLWQSLLQQANQHLPDSDQRLALTTANISEASTQSLCQRLKTPNQVREQAKTLAREWLALMALYRQPSAEGAAKLVKRCDAYRKPEQFLDFLKLAHYILTHQEGFEVRPFDWQEVLTALQAIDPKALMAQGFQGKALGEAIEQERLNRIQQYLANASQ